MTLKGSCTHTHTRERTWGRLLRTPGINHALIVILLISSYGSERGRKKGASEGIITVRSRTSKWRKTKGGEQKYTIVIILVKKRTLRLKEFKKNILFWQLNPMMTFSLQIRVGILLASVKKSSRMCTFAFNGDHKFSSKTKERRL